MPWNDLQSDNVAFPCHTFFLRMAHIYFKHVYMRVSRIFCQKGGGVLSINVLTTLFKNITNLILEDLLRVFT